VRANTIAAVLASAAIVVLCLPGGAVARGGETWVVSGSGQGPARRDGKEHVTQKFSLTGTNGYEVALHLEDRRRLRLDAVKADLRHGTVSNVLYSLKAPQRAHSDDIKVKIAGIARIDVRFVPTKTIKSPVDEGPKCGTGSLTTETGHYVGTISFRGERGYTRVRARSAPGSVERQAPHKCKLPKAVEHDPAVEKEEAGTVDKLEAKEQKGKAEETGEVQMTAIDPGGEVFFAASRNELHPAGNNTAEPTFEAFRFRHRGRLEEDSIVVQFASKGSSFKLPDAAHPTDEAVISPSSPFSGSATFHRNSANSVTWTGNLKVEMPAFGTVPLTGLRVEASLCHASACPGGGFSRLLAPGDPTLR
jgi:hypothetical protein